MGSPKTNFRIPRWQSFCCFAFGAASISTAVYLYRTGGPGWLQLFFSGFSVLCILGIAEAVTDQITLGETEIRIRKMFGIKRIARNEIEKVTWEKGSGVSVRLKNGDWVKIPAMGNNAQGLANSVRSWIRRSK